MWRAFFLAIGIYLSILGLECMAIEKVVLKLHHRAPPPTTPLAAGAERAEGPKREFVPDGWVPWSLVSFGVVTCLYSFTIPKRIAGK
jgi:hypothetical protein